MQLAQGSSTEHLKWVLLLYIKLRVGDLQQVNIWFLHANIYGGLACKSFICIMLSIIYFHGIKIRLYLDFKGASV